jgi:hypothetical protein
VHPVLFAQVQSRPSALRRIAAARPADPDRPPLFLAGKFAAGPVGTPRNPAVFEHQVSQRRFPANICGKLENNSRSRFTNFSTGRDGLARVTQFHLRPDPPKLSGTPTRSELPAAINQVIKKVSPTQPKIPHASAKPVPSDERPIRGSTTLTLGSRSERIGR